MTNCEGKIVDLRNVIQRGPGSPGQSLVIRSSELDAKEQANLEEDLAVMSHLLEKTVGSSLGAQSQASSVLGVNVVFAPGHSPTRGPESSVDVFVGGGGGSFGRGGTFGGGGY